MLVSHLRDDLDDTRPGYTSRCGSEFRQIPQWLESANSRPEGRSSASILQSRCFKSASSSWSRLMNCFITWWNLALKVNKSAS